MMQSMAAIKKAKLLNTDLNMLNEEERDRIEQLAKSLLAVQNAATATGQERQAEKGAFAPEYEEDKG